MFKNQSKAPTETYIRLYYVEVPGIQEQTQLTFFLSLHNLWSKGILLNVYGWRQSASMSLLAHL